MTTLKVLSENVELLAVYNCLVKGLRDAYMSYNITDLGKGSATFTKETSKVEVPIKGAVYPMVVSGVNKFKDQSVSEVTLTVRGAKIKTKFKYSPYPYNNFSYGFDVMSFILSEFLGVKVGTFDCWFCVGMCYIDKFPSEIEWPGTKLVFDYSFPVNGRINRFEVKQVEGGKMSERYIFQLQ